jgi:hypothetical protein
MAALIWKEVPNGFAITAQGLRKPDQFVRIKRQVLGVLKAAPVFRLGRRKLIPLLAGNLTTPTCSAYRGIDKKRFSAHQITSFTSFSH